MALLVLPRWARLPPRDLVALGLHSARASDAKCRTVAEYTVSLWLRADPVIRIVNQEHCCEVHLREPSYPASWDDVLLALRMACVANWENGGTAHGSDLRIRHFISSNHHTDLSIRGVRARERDENALQCSTHEMIIVR